MSSINLLEDRSPLNTAALVIDGNLYCTYNSIFLQYRYKYDVTMGIFKMLCSQAPLKSHYVDIYSVMSNYSCH